MTGHRKKRAGGKEPETNLDWLRRQFIVALAADHELFDLLVLKGGSALALVHRIGLRASVDIDYSIEGDAPDPKALGARIFAALRARVEPHGYVLFDDQFEQRGSGRHGGYRAEFKLISRERFDFFGGDLDRIRWASLASSPEPHANRRFRIEISTFEYCAEKAKKDVELGHACYVYTPQMIAAEKLRSLCQQMDEYDGRAHPAPRARDFYDLHALLTEGRVELSEGAMHDVVRAVFEAKDVPPGLLGNLEDYREFHRSEWPAVLNAIPGSRSRLYDFYFDFIVGEVRKLQPLWVVDAP